MGRYAYPASLFPLRSGGSLPQSLHVGRSFPVLVITVYRVDGVPAMPRQTR